MSILTTKLNISLFDRIKHKDLVNFTRELAILNKAGLSLIRCLISLRDQMPSGKFQSVLSDVIEGIERGDTFSESLSHHSNVFPKLYINMVKSGETGGELDVILKRLAVHLEKEERLRKKIKSALIYPAFVLTIAVVILGLLMVLVIPTFTKIFEDLGGDLPVPTQILIGISNFTIKYWWIMLLGIIGGIQGFRVSLKSNFFKYWFDRAWLYFPVFGKLSRNVAVSSFCRTLGTLLNNGVNIIAALQIVEETQTNLVFANAVPGILQRVKEGEVLGALIEESKIFPSLVVKMISVGEESGELSDMLIQVADNYEEDIDTMVSSLASLLEPMLIVCMGLIVGFIVISMFLPLFNMAQLI